MNMFNNYTHKMAWIIISVCILMATLYSTGNCDESVDGFDDANIIPQVMTSTGASTSVVPVLAPTGRGNVSPKLALNYTSFQKNGWVGVGWNLDLGSIQRNTKTGLDLNGNDFVLNLGGAITDLVSRADDWGTGYFGAQIEGGFSKVYQNSSTKGFVVTATDGTKYYYGSTVDSRQEVSTGLYFKWCLDRVEDTNGNYMTITYLKDSNYLYPSEIKYTGSTKGLSPYYSIVFATEDRGDIVTSGVSGAIVNIKKRLSDITILANGAQVRRYHLQYENHTALTELHIRSRLASVVEYGADNVTTKPTQTFQYQDNTLSYPGPLYESSEGWSVKESSTMAIGDINGDGFPEIVVGANDSVHGQHSVYISRGSANGDYRGSARYSGFGQLDYIYLFDINGDGRKDLSVVGLVTGNGHVSFDTYLSTGETFDVQSAVRVFYAPFMAANRNNFNVVDVNGDGLNDILLKVDINSSTKVESHFYYIEAYRDSVNGGIKFKDSTYYQTGFPNDAKVSMVVGVLTDARIAQLKAANPNVVIVNNVDIRGNIDKNLIGDINGDGRADFVMLNSTKLTYHAFFAHDGGTFRHVVSATGTPQSSWDNGWKAALADINGDGMADLVESGTVSGFYPFWTYFSNGTGNFPTTSGKGMQLPYKKFQFADFNGDRLLDIVNINDCVSCATVPLTIFLSKGDGTFFAHATATINDKGAQLFPDINNDGMADILNYYSYVYTDVYNYGTTREIRSQLTHGAAIPDLLHTINNGSGATTTIDYTTSSKWTNTHLPFVIPTVSKITVDSLSGAADNESLSTSYVYDGGLYDFATREFRGFAKLFQKNPNNTYLRTDYYQDHYRMGKAQKVYTGKTPPDPATNLFVTDAPPAPVYTQSTFTWGIQAINDKVNFPKLDDMTSTSSENGVSLSSTQHNTYAQSGSTGFWHKLSSTSSGKGADTVTTINEFKNYGTWVWRPTKTTITDAANAKVRETYLDYYSSNGNLKTMSFWLSTGANPLLSYTYDIYGNLETMTDAVGNPPTIYVYDSLTKTYPARVTNSAGHVTENLNLDYRFGTYDTAKDANGNQISSKYDTFGRVCQIDYPDGGQLLKDYNFCSNSVLTKVKQADGVYMTKIESADGLGRPMQTITSDESGAAVITRNYSALFNLGGTATGKGPFSSSSAALAWPPTCTSRAYLKAAPTGSPVVEKTMDQLGRVTKITSSSTPNPTYYGYANLANGYKQSTVTNPDGHQKSENTDYLGRLRQVIEYNDAGTPLTTQYTYNAAGDLLSVTNPLNQVTSISYDTLGRKTSMTDPDMGYWQYPEYDGNDKLRKQIDAMGQTTTFGYDALGRILWKDFSNLAQGRATKRVDYTYDLAGIPNSKGQLCRVSNTDVITTYNAFDSMGRVKSGSKSIAGLANAYTTTFDYGVAGQLLRTTYPDGYKVDNSYYAGTGRLLSVTGTRTNDTPQSLLTLSGYNINGQVGTLQFGNSDQTSYTYYNTNGYVSRLQTIATSRPTALTGMPYMDGFDTLLQRSDYTYQPSGTLQTIVESQPAGTISPGPGPAQLIKAFDANSPVHAVKSATLNSTAYPYQYDLNGNLLNGPDFRDPANVTTRTIAYNAANMPTAISPNGITIMYDGNGLRSKKTDGSGNSTYYIGEHYEVHSNGPAVKYIFAGPQRIAMAVGNDPATHTLYFLHQDHLGSDVAITDKDNRVVYRTGSFNPFGRPDTAMGSHPELATYKFTDQEYDAETGLYNFNARLYDPMIGGFVTADTIVPNPSAPQSFNRYAYARGNPLSYTDPSGHNDIGDFVHDFNDSWEPYRDVIVAGILGSIDGGTNGMIRAMGTEAFLAHTGTGRQMVHELADGLNWIGIHDQWLDNYLAGMILTSYIKSGLTTIENKLQEVPEPTYMEATAENVSNLSTANKIKYVALSIEGQAPSGGWLQGGGNLFETMMKAGSMETMLFDANNNLIGLTATGPVYFTGGWGAEFMNLLGIKHTFAIIEGTDGNFYNSLTGSVGTGNLYAVTAVCHNMTTQAFERAGYAFAAVNIPGAGAGVYVSKALFGSSGSLNLFNKVGRY